MKLVQNKYIMTSKRRGVFVIRLSVLLVPLRSCRLDKRQNTVCNTGNMLYTIATVTFSNDVRRFFSFTVLLRVQYTTYVYYQKSIDAHIVSTCNLERLVLQYCKSLACDIKKRSFF